jgi:hypothetical protein
MRQLQGFIVREKESLMCKLRRSLYGPQEVTQSAETTPNEAEVTSSNPPPSLVWTCQKKEKKKKKKKKLVWFEISFETMIQEI